MESQIVECHPRYGRRGDHRECLGLDWSINVEAIDVLLSGQGNMNAARKVLIKKKKNDNEVVNIPFLSNVHA